MEVFVDFCEDAIFEMQHAAALMATGDEEGTTGKQKRNFFNISLSHQKLFFLKNFDFHRQKRNYYSLRRRTKRNYCSIKRKIY